MQTRQRSLHAIAAITVLCCSGAVQSANAAEWEWLVVPYLWGSATEVDVFVNNEPVVGGDLSFSGLLDKLDMAAQVHIEGRRGKGGFFLDFTYLDTSDTNVINGSPLLPDGTELAGDTKAVLVEAGGTVRPGGESHGLDVLFGVRVTDMDMTVDIAPPGPVPPPTQVSVSDTLTDGFVGIRNTAPLGENWFYSLRGDVGAGASVRAWNLVGVLGYSFGKNDRFAGMFGYRHLVMKYETRNVVLVETEMTMSGPMAGFAFRF